MLSELKDFLFPKRCVVCGELETNLCEECKRGLSFTEFQICPMCGENSPMGWTHEKCKKKYGMDGLITIYDYEDEGVRKVIDGIKYEFNQELVEDLLTDFVFEIGEKIDVVIPVPLYFYRENWRGFNQAELLGGVVGSGLLAPSSNLLVRKRNTIQQVKMKNRQERERNIKNAFVIDEKLKKSKNQKLKILLVDDVFTSGADMRECTKVLKKAGAEIVWGLALAH